MSVTRYQRHPDLRLTALEGEGVVLHLKERRYFTVNETGLVLERGPVTVMEDGDYHGEAIVAFSMEGNELYIPFAVELGIKRFIFSSTPTATTTNTRAKVLSSFFQTARI